MKKDHVDKKLKELSIKDNLVFVGSVSLMIQGTNVQPNDIDIVVTDLTGLDNYMQYTTDSKYSVSGKRAYIFGDINVDIFIENELPEYTIIDGLKCATLSHTKRFNNDLLSKVDDYWKNVINEKLKLLK